jgi:hypothetical protein
MARFLYVAARNRRDLYERLKDDFAGQSDVEVLLDRRCRERRTITLEPTANLRRADRRRQRELDRELRTIGSFITASADLVLIVL